MSEREFLTTTPGTRVTIHAGGEIEFTDPPEYAPDDAEAERIAETYADAADELARDEAGEA